MRPEGISHASLEVLNRNYITLKIYLKDVYIFKSYKTSHKPDDRLEDQTGNVWRPYQDTRPIT